MNNRPHNKGFVLLMALLVVAIAGAVLATSARRSHRRLLAAGDAHRDLQVRWGTISVRAMCLPSAELILVRDEAKARKPLVSTRRQITLGGIQFDLIFTDEQAKANADLLSAREGKAGIERSVRALQAGLRRIVAVELHPAEPKPRPKTVEEGMAPELYTSLDQILLIKRPADLVPHDARDATVADRLTCWSNGKVNFKRADSVVLREVLHDVLDESHIARLINFNRKTPDGSLYEAVEAMDLTDEKRQAALERLTDTSYCHGLWVIARTAGRNWYTFTVARDGAKPRSFAW